MINEGFGGGQKGGPAKKLISLFDFVGKTNYISSHKGESECCVAHRQDGFILRETGYPYRMKKIRPNPSISVTWSQTSIMLIFHSRDGTDTFTNIFVNTDQNYTNAIPGLQDIGLVSLSAHNIGHLVECVLLPIPCLEVQFYKTFLGYGTHCTQHISLLLMWNTRRSLCRASLRQCYWRTRKAVLAGLIISHKMIPGSKIYWANMGPTWVLSAPVGPHVGPINLAIKHSYRRQPPMVFARSFVILNESGRVWKLVCINDLEDNFNCSHVNTSVLNACPKTDDEPGCGIIPGKIVISHKFIWGYPLSTLTGVSS